MTKAKFSKKLLGRYKIIEYPGTYVIPVSSTASPKHLIEDEYPRYLINLRANTEKNLLKCLDILGLREECSFEEVKKYFLSGVLWKNDVEEGLELPTKGERVIATFEYDSQNKLFCSNITLIPRKTLKTFNPELYDDTQLLIKKLFYNDTLYNKS